MAGQLVSQSPLFWGKHQGRGVQTKALPVLPELWRAGLLQLHRQPLSAGSYLPGGVGLKGSGSLFRAARLHRQAPGPGAQSLASCQGNRRPA